MTTEMNKCLPLRITTTMTTAKILSSSLLSPSFCSPNVGYLLHLLPKRNSAVIIIKLYCATRLRIVLTETTSPCIFLATLGDVQRYSLLFSPFLNLRLRSSNAATAKVHLVKRRQRESADLPSLLLRHLPLRQICSPPSAHSTLCWPLLRFWGGLRDLQ